MFELNSLGDQIDAVWSPLGDAAAFRLTSSLDPEPEGVRHNDDEQFEVGSCFKAFIAAECCRQVSSGLLSWEEPLRVEPERRVPASARADRWLDGSTVTLDQAARAMIAVSDNTATDMVMDLIGHDTVVALVSECGLARTNIPRSTGAVYAQPEHVRPIACTSTMRELIRFYATVLSPGSPLDEIAQSDFRRLMRQEDLEQGTRWPDGVVCYRKSGSLEPPPILAMAMAGAFATERHHAEFAFALNPETSDAAAMTHATTVFIEGVTLGMKALATDL